jgi:hypothetical protein
MQGVDIERIMAVINEIKDEASTQITNLSFLSDYRIETISHSHNVRVESSDGSHSHGSGAHHHDFMLTGNSPTGGSGLTNHVSDQLTYPAEYTDDVNPDHKHIEPSVIYEREHVELSLEFTGNIISMGVVLGDDAGKMKEIENNMYTGAETFNNSYGSPWKEIYMLKGKIDKLEEYATQHSTLQWIGEKYALINLMQIILSYAVDAKWAITHYQDYMQRGYDNQFNDKKASVVWDDFEKGGTIGNRDQEFSDNVNIERESNDPY